MTLAQIIAAFALLGALLTAATWLDWSAIAVSVDSIAERIAALCYPVADPFLRWLL